MKQTLDNDKPIYLQVKEAIEEDILAGRLKPDAQIPSNNQIVAFYGINPVTVHKGVSLLSEEGIIYKKRGLGMFVSPDAPELLRNRHRALFRKSYVLPLVRQAAALGMDAKTVHKLIDEQIQELSSDKAW